MAEYKYLFTMYADCFYKTAEKGKPGKAEFIRTLLKMGLDDNSREIINKMFPKVKNKKGNLSINKKSADRLRKYLSDENDISEVASEISEYFNDEIYINELNEYEETAIIEFANKLVEESDNNKFNLKFKLNTSIDDIENISKEIATFYGKILNEAAAKKSGPNKAKDNQRAILSYTITESEKKALINLCELIRKALRNLNQQTEQIELKQSELKKFIVQKQTDQIDCEQHEPKNSDEKDYSDYLKENIKSLKKRFNDYYSELESLCSDLVEFLEPKQGLNKDFPILISLANNIGDAEYRITCPDKFKYTSFALMISKFNACIQRILRVIDKL